MFYRFLSPVQSVFYRYSPVRVLQHADLQGQRLRKCERSYLTSNPLGHPDPLESLMISVVPCCLLYLFQTTSRNTGCIKKVELSNSNQPQLYCINLTARINECVI